MDIEKEINTLSDEDKIKFQKELIDVLYDRFWCRNHGINYAEPDSKKVKEILYTDLFVESE